MTFVLDISDLLEIANDPLALMWFMFAHGGWIILLTVVGVRLFHQERDKWLDRVRAAYDAKRVWVLLHVAIPRDNTQSPKAVEQIISELSVAYSDIDFDAKWKEGKTPDLFSLEIATEKGVVNYYIRTQEKYRDLVEAALYAQYPQAEIMEVEDYATALPQFPNPGYELWGTEFVLIDDQHTPIRTHAQFDSSHDPIAGMIEAMGRVALNEHAWFQIVLTPISDGWREGGLKVLGLAKPPTPTKTQEILTKTLETISYVSDQITGFEGGGGGDDKKTEASDLDKMKATGVHSKISKIGYKVTMRYLYWGPKDVFAPNRGASPFVGALKQFNTLGGNGFKQDGSMTTKAGTPLELAKKQNAIASYYKGRTMDGSPEFILNVEELATLWHFPVVDLKTPMVSNTNLRQSEPPRDLPAFVIEDTPAPPPGSKSAPPSSSALPPSNLPIG